VRENPQLRDAQARLGKTFAGSATHPTRQWGCCLAMVLAIDALILAVVFANRPAPSLFVGAAIVMAALTYGAWAARRKP
jgi:hypothetical protein